VNLDEFEAETRFIPSRHFLSGAPAMIKPLRFILAIPFLLLGVACSTQPTSTSGTGDPELDAKGREALQQLFDTTPKAKDLQYQAKAVLVFPDIVKAGLLVGAQGGKGVLIGADGKILGYYRARAVSYGLQAGAQTFSEAMFLMTDDALNNLSTSDGGSVGVGPSVVVMDAGMAKSMTTTTMKSDVYAFIFGQQGLMAGMGVQGQKITKLDLDQ
jgi:lipid-binding SYLF domain-containing protein